MLQALALTTAFTLGAFAAWLAFRLDDRRRSDAEFSRNLMRYRRGAVPTAKPNGIHAYDVSRGDEGHTVAAIQQRMDDSWSTHEFPIIDRMNGRHHLPEGH